MNYGVLILVTMTANVMNNIHPRWSNDPDYMLNLLCSEEPWNFEKTLKDK